MKLEKIVKYLDAELKLADFPYDVSNNGLQIEAGSEIKKIVFGVDGCFELFEAAAACNANMVIVHHGISWGAKPRRFNGYVGKRLEIMFQNNISLYAAHLPLDAHNELGNNAQLCKILGLEQLEKFFEYDDVKIGFICRLPRKMLLKDIAAIYEEVKGRPRYIVRLDTDAMVKQDGEA